MAATVSVERQGPQVIVGCREQLQIPARQAAQVPLVGRVRRVRRGLQEIPQPSPDRVVRRVGQVRRARRALQAIPQPSLDRVAPQEGQARQAQQGLRAQQEKKATPAFRTLESVAPLEIQARLVILERHRLSLGRLGIQDGLARQDPQAIQEKMAIMVKQAQQEGQVRQVQQGLRVQPAKKAMPASRTLELPEIQARLVILGRHRLSLGRLGIQDGLARQDPQVIQAKVAIMVKQARQVPQVIKEFLDQINLPPSPLRLRAPLLLC